MCDVCADFHDLLLSYEERASKEQNELAALFVVDVETILHYVNQWVQRQCMCCYREVKNFDRFIRLTQSIVLCTLQQLQAIHQNGQCVEDETDTANEHRHEKEKTEKEKLMNVNHVIPESWRKYTWSQQDREKLFHLLSKIFLLNFPLYIAMKHGGVINPLAPIKDEGGYCEPHDPEVPAPMIRAVSIFCHQGGFDLMSACFDMKEPLPVGLAHSIVAVICNLKLWLNYGSVIQLFVPLRSRVMKYMCRLGDKELRTPAVRTMADFMWSAAKDPIDAVLPTFDRDGLDLAFKYFTSTTLTMRLAGIAQINAHITAFNELCNSETVAEIEQVGHALAAWLTENNIIAHIFGPNLHVEVIKQSHIVLSFLAMEGRISSSDMDTMWQAAQLKHCGRPVYDLLAPLVKHLAPTPVLHLYSLLGKLEPKDHTEQSLFLASALIKFIWTSGGSGYPRGLSAKGREALKNSGEMGGTSSSDPSGMDGSSPEEDEEEPSPAPSEGPSPRKQARGDSSDCEVNFKMKGLESTSPGANFVKVEELPLANVDQNSDMSKSSALKGATEGVTITEEKFDGTCVAKDKQSGTDAEADTEKSNTEETVTQEKKKRKVFRKRKKPQKRSAFSEKALDYIVRDESNRPLRKDLPSGKVDNAFEPVMLNTAGGQRSPTDKIFALADVSACELETPTFENTTPESQLTLADDKEVILTQVSDSSLEPDEVSTALDVRRTLKIKKLLFNSMNRLAGTSESTLETAAFSRSLDRQRGAKMMDLPIDNMTRLADVSERVMEPAVLNMMLEVQQTPKNVGLSIDKMSILADVSNSRLEPRIFSAALEAQHARKSAELPVGKSNILAEVSDSSLEPAVLNTTANSEYSRKERDKSRLDNISESTLESVGLNVAQKSTKRMDLPMDKASRLALASEPGTSLEDRGAETTDEATLESQKGAETLDRVKHQAMEMEPSDQEVPTTAALLRGVNKASKYVSLVGHSVDRVPNSADSSHDEDDSDVTGIVGPSGGTGTVMSELTGLVHATGPRFLPSGLDDMLSDEEGSYSSRISNKSEKNMADFDGEESGCEEELAQLAARHLTAIQMQAYHPHNSHPTMTIGRSVCRAPQVRTIRQTVARLSSQFNLETVCKPGNTLLWDLLQDDKIGQLGEGLALEAEKALCNLLCFNVERLIPMKFIEGCLENLAANRSVVVSLRLLPKLLASFQQFGTMDAHAITTWADRERNMMKHFFNNLKTYAATGPKTNLYSHQTEVQVRLQFLSSIFSPLGSPDCFRLSLEQVDILWQCLSQDSTCADELFSWLLSQAKSTEQHALGMDTLKHLCMRKLPSLPPEAVSMTGLSLFQQLCNLARLAAAHLDRPLRDVDSVGMDFLWRIALKAKSTDVSMAAIQYLNGYYMSRQLTQEAEFVSQCMTHLAAASADLEINEEASLRCIQRALLLLRTHLEAFRKRYAYHLRRWALEGRGTDSHIAMSGSERGQQLRIYVQPAGIPDKTSFTLLSTDYVADLRAEVAKWWDDMQNEQEKNPSSSVTSASVNNGGSVLGSLLSDGPIRMITQGQELTIDFDEKTLQEMGFKDGQLVFISLGAGRGTGSGRSGKRDLESPSLLPPPSRDSLPTLLLLRPQYFEQLFTLMRTLSAMKTTVKGGQEIPHTKAQVLSRRVWDTLTLLPTSPTLLRGFQKLEEASLPELLDPASPQKLMYSLYIVESLSKRGPPSRPAPTSSSTATPVHEGGGGDADDNQDDREKETSWSTQFVQHGGLRHLFDIFMSGCLERGDGSEWQQDCLASLLKQLCHLGVVREERKRGKPDKLLVPRLSEAMLAMMDMETVMPRLTNILIEASLPRDPNHYKTGLFGRSQVIHYAMALLVCWVHSDLGVRHSLFSSTEPFGKTWLRRLVLEDPEPAVRREVCTALYRLCLGITGTEDENADTSNLIVPILNTLLEHLAIAETMLPSPRKPDLPLHLHPVLDDGKEPYGPACRDYFWLVCRLVDSLPDDVIREEGSDESSGAIIDLEALAHRAIDSALSREHLETRHNTVEDDGLVGLLNLICNIMTHNPSCKQDKIGQNLLCEVFDFLFALPSPKTKHVPKCKSQASRSAAFDLLVELVKAAPNNYKILHEKLLAQHRPGRHSPYPWDYWPHEDGRSDCGYVGLTNLGATCYMASCMQHLYMMPQARVSILGADCNRANKHQLTLRELQRMFAYLLESERKAYNPRSFCRVYTMNHEPLNTGEQKDMAEFFIDLVSKLEEMTSDLKNLVKTLFCGVISNNVVSLDCEHVSRTLEEFYTVRCQVADMRNLYESLDEVTVKDTLEGDNMYTCSQCGKKARAEKRACFKKLPHILCFNTMRYTFNMGTMLKEKVNTHFSFPLRLDMSGYVEKKLMPQQYQDEKKKALEKRSEAEGSGDFGLDEEEMEHYLYDLIGVTVHTGTADGGHYYSFIRDRTSLNKDKWFLFNDAEVKPFDPNQIAAECFGGEMTSKTYDSVTDKFMDFSFEKTNSAYMLFYEWCTDPVDPSKDEEATVSSPRAPDTPTSSQQQCNPRTDKPLPLELNKELEDWIWQDNMHFLQDKNIFEHTYFSFMWQICGYIPHTMQPDITEMSAELSTSFFMETFIHAKEKPTMVQWVELLTKQFNGSAGACARFLERMAADSWWPIQILVKCPNQMVRQMFQRLCIHVIQRLRATQAPLYLACDPDSDPTTVGTRSCVTRYVRMLLSLMEHAKQHLKHLTEYFSFLYEFSKMGEEETLFLIQVQAISTMVNFYLGHKTHEYVDAVSEEEEEEEVVTLAAEKLRPASLDKMITLIATLVERSRGPDHRLTLSPADLNAVAGGKGFPFLYQQTRDTINLNQTRNLIQSLCRWNDRLAIHIVTMIFQAITKHTDVCQPFFKLLTLLTEGSGPSGLPCMTQLILGRVWEAARVAPHGALEWLALAVTRSKLAHAWVLQGLDTWLQHFLLEHTNQRVRSAAAFLLVSLVPSTQFRQGYRNAHRLGLGCNPTRELQLSSEATLILHQIYTALLRLLQPARHYIDIQTHGTMKLTAYFALLTYCVVSKTEKLMFGQYLNDLWTLFHPKLSEPSIPVHHNKQAVLLFWYHVCSDCPENVATILHNPHITKNIAFNYILADHEDQDVVLFNRVMLPAYYGLLRLCCQQSRGFTRQLAAHQNIQWAFKNITPHPTQYSTAVDELFKLMQLLVARHPDQTEQEEAEIASFRRGTLSSYLQGLDGRSCWATLISAFRILIESDDDRLYVVYNGGLSMALEAFHMLHVMYHEATACHVAGDLAELIAIIVELVRCIRTARDGPDARSILANCKEWPDVLRKLATLLNTYNPPDMRNLAIDLLKELVMLVPAEAILILAPLLSHCHAALQESHAAVPPGPYLPRRTAPGKMASRPARPMVQMAVPHSQLEASKGVDPEYDSALLEFYLPYHELIDVMCRLAINNDCMTDTLVNLSAMLGFEGVPLHLALFPRLWLDVHAATHIDRKHIAALLCSSYTVDYVDAVLLDERSSLGVPAIHAFLKTFFPKLASHVLTEQTCSLIDNLVSSLTAMVEAVDPQASAHRLTGDLRALALVYSSGTRLNPPVSLQSALETLLSRTKAARMKEASQREAGAPSKKRKFNPGEEGEREGKKVPPETEETDERKRFSLMDVESKARTGKKDDAKSVDSGEDEAEDEAKTTAGNSSAIPPNPITASTASGRPDDQLRCTLTNVSWLEMLEKTIVNLQMIVQLQIKNN